MSYLLGIPREIRDEIYELTLRDPLQSSKDPNLQRDRKRIAFEPTDPETHYGENRVCYPMQTSAPPAQGLLSAARQLRTEFLETVKRLGPIRYKVDVSSRQDNGLITPTWIAVPLFTDRIDILDAQWRYRNKKTSSVATFNGDDITAWGQGFSATLAMLQRFIERGVYLLSKKKRKNIHIGLLAINMDSPADMSREYAEIMADQIVTSLDQWMLGVEVYSYDEDAKEREHVQFDLLTGRIDRLQFSLNRVVKKEWIMADEVAKRQQEQAKVKHEAAIRRFQEFEEINRVLQQNNGRALDKPREEIEALREEYDELVAYCETISSSILRRH
jgi:hypothetical protein